MSEEIIVLRSIEAAAGPSGQEAFLGGASAAAGPRRFTVERVPADPREIVDVRRERNVVAAAPAMPLKLYRPRAAAASGALTAPLHGAGRDAWGLRAVGAHESFCSGIGASVAILDTGIDASHEAFADLRERRALVQKDFTGEGDGDADGHGTHCAATAFGGRVGGVALGVAPNVASAIVAKVIGSAGATTAGLARAIEWAIVEQGANVVSMSLGIDFPGHVGRLVAGGYPPDLATSLALEAYRDTLDLFAAIAAKSNAGRTPVVFVAAAGNASDSDRDPRHVIGLEPPAAARGIVSVSAVGERGPGSYYVPGFSNGRARVCGPGVDVVSAKAGSGAGTIIMSGTSMATPRVAGVAALWYEWLAQAPGASFGGQVLADRLVGSGRLDGIDHNRIGDVGTGLVRAPRD